MTKILKIYQKVENSLSYLLSNNCDEGKFLKKIGVFGLNKVFTENFSQSFLELLQQTNLKFEFHDPGEYFKPEKILEHVDHHFKKILENQNELENLITQLEEATSAEKEFSESLDSAKQDLEAANEALKEAQLEEQEITNIMESSTSGLKFSRNNRGYF